MGAWAVELEFFKTHRFLRRRHAEWSIEQRKDDLLYGFTPATGRQPAHKARAKASASAPARHLLRCSISANIFRAAQFEHAFSFVTKAYEVFL
jgi:hypothetical protein